MLRVALIARATLLSSPGGDTTQVQQTAAGLRRLGVDARVFTTDQHIPYADFQLLHFFNIIRPADILRHTARTRVPYVVSTIFLDYGAFEKQGRRGAVGLLGRALSEDGMEYVKAIARRLKNGERIGSRQYLLRGHRRAVIAVAGGARMLLPNSESEIRRFVARYGCGEQPYRVVPNGINEQIAQAALNMPEAANAAREGVLCVARVEGRKNQLNLIRALQGAPYPLYIHGKPSPNNRAYYESCKAADADVRFTDWLDEADLYALYRRCRVHILPSYFETTGLSSLEAAVMGCNIVVTPNGDTRDYFGSHAWYCEPDDPASIRKAVDAAYSAPFDPAFRDAILRDYTWDRAAEETLAAYRAVLEG